VRSGKWKEEAHLSLMTPFFVDAITRLFPLITGLHLGYDSTYLDLPEIRRKLMIERK
jgi:hypothetical protein